MFEKIKSSRKWYLKNRERVIQEQIAYRKEKMKNDYKFRMSVVQYQSKYYQNKKNKLKEEKLHIDYKPQKNIKIDTNDTIVQF